MLPHVSTLQSNFYVLPSIRLTPEMGCWKYLMSLYSDIYMFIIYTWFRFIYQFKFYGWTLKKLCQYRIWGYQHLSSKSRDDVGKWLGRLFPRYAFARLYWIHQVSTNFDLPKKKYIKENKKNTHKKFPLARKIPNTKIPQKKKGKERKGCSFRGNHVTAVSHPSQPLWSFCGSFENHCMSWN